MVFKWCILALGLGLSSWVGLDLRRGVVKAHMLLRQLASSLEPRGSLVRDRTSIRVRADTTPIHITRVNANVGRVRARIRLRIMHWSSLGSIMLFEKSRPDSADDSCNL